MRGSDTAMVNTKRVVLIQPESQGGNFEYVAIPRQGMLFLSGALKQWDNGDIRYETEIWFEDRIGRMDPDKDLLGVDILMVTALVNEAPRAFEIGRLAKQFHPKLITIGGGPQMSPLAEEAMREGHFDIIVNREGEDIIGQLCDVLLTFHGTDREKALLKIPGISFMTDLHCVATPRAGVIAPDFVELPDFRAIKGLTSANPMAGGVLETTRGCTEKCTYCQVIQQFLGYRLIKRDTELKRLRQLRQLAADGLIHTSRDGRFSVFISDDLHPPPLRAVKYRDERLARLKGWKGHTDDMYMICQARAEIGQDPELAEAMYDAGIKMLYLGVESDNAENLEVVRKRQEPGQMHKDLTELNARDFSIVAMTIIGLPFDTEDSIMQMADWVTEVSKYQTANLLTPLPATSNWTDLKPLDEDGSLLPDGKLRPYHLYTGRQFVHEDPRWSMSESRELFERYQAKLNPVDILYGRILRLLRTQTSKLSGTGKEFTGAISARINEFTEILKTMSESPKELPESISTRLGDIKEVLSKYGNNLTANGRELPEILSTRIFECSEALTRYKSQISNTGKDVSDTITSRINDVHKAVTLLSNLSRPHAQLAE